MNISPWDSPNAGRNFGGGNMRQGGGDQGTNAQSFNLANSLLNNSFRNQNLPSLLDLPRGGGGVMGNRNQRGGPMVNRGGPGNRQNSRRVRVRFQNRGTAGPKSAPKQGAGGIRSKQNAFVRAKKLLTKNANNKQDSVIDDKKNESKESPYATVANDMFYCHFCKKHMWDTNSFENHIKGRTHLMMRERIEESYSLKANMIRQEAKIAEQLKTIELDRLKRMGKTKQRQLEYCTMCDLNFHGYISDHRKSECHLQLKKFLHPKCIECNEEFANRIDYDTHLLSAEHFQKAALKNTKVRERKRNTLTILTEEEELKDVRPPQKRRKKAVPQKPVEDAEVKKEGENAEAKKENEEGDELKETQEEEEVALPVDPDDCILDYSDGDQIPIEVDNRLPKYNWTRPVGTGLIAKLECFECSLCSKFFDTDKTVEVHSRTVTHHRNFLKFINEKSSDTKVAKKRAETAFGESERKLEEVETAAAGETAVTVENGNAEGGEEKLYDPSETTGADGEEGDFEMIDDQGDGEDGEGEEGGDEEDMGAQCDGEQDGDGDQDQETEPKPVKEQPKPEPVKTTAKSAQNTPDSTPVPPLITPARAAPNHY